MSRQRPVGPSWVRLAKRVVGGVFGPSPAEEVDEEFDFHIEMTVGRYLREGMTLEEARAEATRRFGDVDRVKAECRASGKRRMRKMSRRAWLEDLRQDLRFGFRQLTAHPGFALVVVATLAIGIGANSAVFSVVRGVLLRPLPYPEPDDLVQVWSRFLPESGYDFDVFPVSPREAISYRDASDALSGLAYYWPQDVTLTGDGDDPARLSAILSSSHLPEVLGVPPAMGRWFTGDEARPEGAAVVVLGHDLWATRFASDPGIVGRRVFLNGTSVQVVGVMPRGFAFPERGIDLYLPLRIDESNPGGWGNHGPRAVARLAPGRTLAEAGAELEGLVGHWREEFGHPQRGHTLYLVSLSRSSVAEVRTALWVLMGAVLLVLLIASANVANILMARGEARAREVSVRRALGASRMRIARQLLTESLVLASCGALLGTALGAAAVRLALRLNPDALPRSESIGMDLPVLAFTAAVTVGVALLFGLFPGLAVGGRRGAPSPDARVSGSAQGRRLRGGLILAEVALSLVVVLGAGLVVRSLAATLQVDPGMDVEGRLSFELALPAGGYATPEEVRVGIAATVERLEAIPGVRSASFASSLPLTGNRYVPDFFVEGRALPEAGERQFSALVMVVTPGHLETAGIGLVRGRSFQAGDSHGGTLVALVSREAARVYWPNQDPLGARISFAAPSDSTPWVTVVGVVEDTRTDGLRTEVRPQIYLPHGQEQGFWGRNERSGFAVVRAAVPPLSLVPALRQALAEVDPELPLAGVRTFDTLVEESVAPDRFAAALLGSFGVIALVLAMVGVYGVVSYTVARRTREIGIRVALGADRGSVVRLMIREGMRPALFGVALGVGLALLGGSLLEGMLFGVSATDPATFIVLPLGLALVTVVASWIPSRRAVRVAPTEALRQE